MQYWMNSETGKVIAADGPAWGQQWFEIDEAEYQAALHPLTPEKPSIEEAIVEAEKNQNWPELARLQTIRDMRDDFLSAHEE